MAKVGRKVLDLGPAAEQIGLNVLVDRNGHQLIRGGDQSFSGIKTFSTPPRVQNDKFLSDTTVITKKMLLEKTRCLGEVFEETLTVTEQDITNGWIKLSKDIAPGHADSLEIVYYEGAGDMAVGVDFGYVTEGDGKVNKLQWQGWPLGRPGLVVTGQEIQVRYNVCRVLRKGIVWTAQESSVFLTSSVCWVQELGLFFAAGGDDYNLLTSPDGVTWTKQPMPYNRSWDAVCWSPERGLFCAVGWYFAATSPDGVNWTSHTIPAWEGAGHVYWLPGPGLFYVTVRMSYDDGHHCPVAFSPDGSTWTEHAIRDLTSICWSPELGVACALRKSNKAATSTDGINWTSHTMPVAGSTSICWSPERGLFCAVGKSNKAATSPDGATWTEQTMPEGDWDAVCWSPELGLFCAVGKSNKAATSPDGVNWTSQTIPAARLTSICWSSELRSFCAMGLYKALLGKAA